MRRMSHASKLSRVRRQRWLWTELNKMRLPVICIGDEPEVLQKPADLVLEIPLDLNEQRSADEKSLDSVTVESFDAHLLVPATLHDTRDAHSILTVALVDLHLQSRLRVPGNRFTRAWEGHSDYGTVWVELAVD